MAGSLDGQRITISTVLTKDQVRRAQGRRLRRMQDMPGTVPSMADVYRELIEAGLAVLPHVADSLFETSPEKDPIEGRELVAAS